ncbi:MAG TPA: crotonase/enoyl-CoA hydratase family protein [Micropepsaceae bacterium]|nr:crotonase/enoyl-CoA hydratase family protein [Micropepsaceae bacterium]
MAESEGGTAVRVEKLGPVSTVILDRGEVRNAVDRPTAAALAAAFFAFENDASAKVAVLWGAGGNFCAGADLKAIAKGGEVRNLVVAPTPGNRLAVDAPMGPTRMRLSKPVIAAIAGHAVAGGLELALWCDLRVAEDDTVFGVFSRRWGVPLIDGGTIRLPRTIGHGRAMDIILTGRPVDAAEAFEIGLVNRVVGQGESRAAAEAWAAELARFPEVCLKSDRRSAYEQWGLDEEAAFANEFALGMKALEANETFAGAARFAEGKGRKGSFEDL